MYLPPEVQINSDFYALCYFYDSVIVVNEYTGRLPRFCFLIFNLDVAGDDGHIAGSNLSRCGTVETDAPDPLSPTIT